MKIFWFHSGLMPMACDALGYNKRDSCGWLESMLNALLAADSKSEFCLLGWDPRPCDIQIGRVRYVSLAVDGPSWYRKIPKKLSDRVKKLITEFNPDVIHVQGTEYFYGCFAKEVYCGKPVVVSLQGIITGYCPHVAGYLSPHDVWWTKFNLRWLLKRESILNNQVMWQKGRATQEEKVLKAQRFFIGRTEWDEAWTHYLNPSARYFHVNENLRPPFFKVRRERQNIIRHRIYCGAAASCPHKAAHWIIRAVAALATEFPDIELRIAAAESNFSKSCSLVARLKGQAYHAYLRRLVKQLGVEKHIVALPSLRAEKVAEELASAELFVLPSLCENSPNSLGEAMLVGTPSIATFVGGVPSILKDGVEGKLVPPGDPAALAGAIRRWFLHPEEAEACVEPARATALKRHDAKANAEATLAVYRALTNG